MLVATLFGQFSVQLHGQTIQIASRPAQVLLAYLLLYTDATHRRDYLAGLLWPDSLESSARKNLRNTVWQLRKTLPDDYLLVDHETVAFNTALPYEVDVARFADPTAVSDPEALITAVSHYKGNLLPGYYEEWIQQERTQLDGLYARRLQTLLEQLSAAGRWREIPAWAERWLSHDPAAEPAYRALMLTDAILGNQAGVAAAYRRCEQTLRAELSLSPSSATTELYDRLLRGDLPAHAPTAVIEVEGNTAVPPPPPEEPPPPAADSSLPPLLTPFVGREKEKAELQVLLTGQPERRLVTILGPGGIGKTRLSLEVANNVKNVFADGVYFIPLAPLKTAEHFNTTVAEALGFRFYQVEQPKQQLLDYLRDKQCLLIMDNFEHLLDNAWQLTELLLAAPQVKILVSSRERLNLSAETIYTLGGMDYPEWEDRQNGVEYGAVQLLMHSARLVRPDMGWDSFNLDEMVRICQLVQGMPLALVLAAGWLELLSFGEIADEIAHNLDFLESQAQDAPERQRSMRAAFDYSWKRLPEAEKQTFMALSVLRGTFSRQAAQAITGATLKELRTLVNKSFLLAGPDGRYQVHELLRQFGEAYLEEAGLAAQVRQAHGRHYLTRLREIGPDLYSARQRTTLTAIEKAIENVRAAWHWALEQAGRTSGEPIYLDLINGVMEPLAMFYGLTGLLEEGEQVFRQAAEQLEQGTGVGCTAVHCYALVQYADFLLEQGRTREAAAVIQKLTDLAAAQADENRLADINFLRGTMHRQNSDLDAAIAILERAAANYGRLGRTLYRVRTLNQLGEAQSRKQLLTAALTNHQEALRLATELGDIHAQAVTLGYLGGDHYFLDEYPQALNHYQRAQTLFEQMEDRAGMARILVNTSFVHGLLGNYAEALQETRQGIALYHYCGQHHSAIFSHDTLGEIYMGMGDFVQAREAFSQALQQSQLRGQDWEMGWIRTNLGLLDMAEGRYEAAETQLQQALALRRAVGNPREIAVTIGVLGMLYGRNGRFPDALAHLSEAITTLSQVGERYQRSRFLVEQGALLLEMGKEPEACDVLQSGLELAEAIGRRPVAEEARALLAHRDDAAGAGPIKRTTASPLRPR